MPRFYFDVREGVRFVSDQDGLEFPDLDAAEREAAETAAEIGRSLLPVGIARSVTVEVRNEHGQRVVTATVTLAVDRVYPEPSAPWLEGLGKSAQPTFPAGPASQLRSEHRR